MSALAIDAYCMRLLDIGENCFQALIIALRAIRRTLDEAEIELLFTDRTPDAKYIFPKSLLVGGVRIRKAIEEVIGIMKYYATDSEQELIRLGQSSNKQRTGVSESEGP